MHSKKRLSLPQSRVRYRIALLDTGISHGIATNGDATAVDHEGTARSVVMAVISVRISEIESKMEPAMRVHPFGCNKVEALWTLEISLTQFRSEIAGVRAYPVGPIKLKSPTVIKPHLKLLFRFENADEERGSEPKPPLPEGIFERRRDAFDDRTGGLA